VPKTTEQLASLIESRGESLKTITLNVDDLISSPERILLFQTLQIWQGIAS
jgi:hypothetical protein